MNLVCQGHHRVTHLQEVSVVDPRPDVRTCKFARDRPPARGTARACASSPMPDAVLAVLAAGVGLWL